MDLTLVAIPGYFASMGAEHVWLRRHRDERGPTPGDYEWRDTLTSLLMGQASLFAPMLFDKLLDPIRPGSGRYAKAAVGVAIGAAGVVTVADVVAKRVDDDRPARRRVARVARRVSGSAAVTSLTAAGLSAAALWSTRTAARRLFDKRVLPDLGDGPLAVAVAVLGWDFIYYWNHRLAHENRYLWAMHVVHHSSERYNLSTALRQPVADAVTVSVPYGALALAGLRPEVIETARELNLLYQYWIHTEVVPRMPRMERVLNSPSLHRVHHGSNRKYLDRNHGSILIIWDRLFGTYQPEEEPVVYGLTRNISTFNPLVVAGHEWRDIARDVAASRTWADRLGFLLRGPGWAYARRDEIDGGGVSRPSGPPVPATSVA